MEFFTYPDVISLIPSELSDFETFIAVVFMTPKIEGKVLVYGRRRYNRFLYETSKRTFSGDILFCTDWAKDWSGELTNIPHVDFMPDFYSRYNLSGVSSHSILSEEELTQIVTRCRLLRALPWVQATSMVQCMYLTLKDLVVDYEPDYFLTLSVDQYIGDVFCRVCEHLNITSVLFMDGSIKNTMLCFKYGEYNSVRKPTDGEIDLKLDELLDNTYHLTYGQKSKEYSFNEHFRHFFVFWAKYLVFKVIAILSRDTLNYRYLVHFLRIEGDGQSDFFNWNINVFFDSNWEDIVRSSQKPVLYIPLSFTPECSTDYWLKDLRYVDYENFILNLCNTLSPDYLLLLKDHWAMQGKRQRSFYKKLQSISQVVLVPPTVNGRAILELVDRVLVGSGTAGVEAALRGKRVVTLSPPYYYLEGFYLSLNTADDVNDIYDRLEQFSPPSSTVENRRLIMKRFLESTLLGSVRVDSKINTDENYETVSKSLRQYLSQEHTH